MTRIKADSEIDYVRKLVEHAIWAVLYHEGELITAHRRVAFVKAIVKRGFPEIDVDALTAADEDDEHEEETAAQYIVNLVANELASVKFHEDNLREEHGALAFIKALLMRGNYSEIDLEQIRHEQAERLAKRGD